MGSSLKDQLLKKYPPKPTEVWHIENNQIFLDDENATPKKYRPAIVIYNSSLKFGHAFNIIPCTKSAKPGLFHIPIARALRDTLDGFTPDPNSCAIIHLYQPVRLNFFKKRLGKIEDNTYDAIMKTLCYEFIGLDFLDVTP